MYYRTLTPPEATTPDACLFASNSIAGRPSPHGDDCCCVFTPIEEAPAHLPKMTLCGAQAVLQAPDLHPLEDVAEAALVVLETRGAPPEDVDQAIRLITTFRRAMA